ncbi:hypothetical protein BJV74DRAFT_960349 [Russula compacta]|nr:hypothetical protein BJV74DRAFT_960349 [Russula compacta]
MFSFAMDSIFAISLGFALRLVVDTASHHNDRVGSSLVGLWEGAVLYHFLEKWPKSFDPYVGLGFRLLVDFLFTESIYRLAIVLLWTGLGFVLSDVTPAFWYDKNLHRFYRRTRRYIRHFDWSSLRLPIPSGAISRVRFYDLPPYSAPASTSPPAPSDPGRRRHSVPGNFPGFSYSSSTDASTPPPTSILRRPVPATSLPPSALRSASHPKPSSSSSVSFGVAAPASDIDGDSFDELVAGGMPAPMPVPPHIVMPVPVQAVSSNQTLNIEPASSTLVPPNIDLLPEIIEPREDPDPPPSFEDSQAHPAKEADTTAAAAGGASPVRGRPSEKLTVANPDFTDAGSARSSIISGGNRNSIIVRADLLREQARAEEKERDRLHTEHKKAYSEKRYPDAVRYKVEQDEANERAMELHRRAAERYFKAHNLQQEERTIDVHRLKRGEAIRRTEIAIRDALLAGNSRLRVICGRGNHSERGLPILRLALTHAMEQHKIESEVDPTNPGVLHIKLPVS